MMLLILAAKGRGGILVGRELLKFEILHGSDPIKRCDRGITLLLCLDGGLTFKAGDELTTLGPDDILLVNPKTAYSLGGTDCLFVRYVIDIGEFRKVFLRRYRFQCDSTKESNDNYGILRRYLANLLLHYEGGEYEQAETQKLIYELLIFLVRNFTLSGMVPEPPEKIDTVIDCIDDNFQDALSLEIISAHFYMASPSFSRFFKKQMGITFYQYLSKIRLEYAVEDLLYTNKNLLHVALDNGFPNAESFSRYFSESFRLSPHKYRVQYKAAHKARLEQQQATLSAAIAHLSQKQEQPGSPRQAV